MPVYNLITNTVATGELLDIKDAICSTKRRTLVWSLKLDLNPDCVSSRIARPFSTFRSLVRNSLSITFKKILSSAMGLVLAALQMDSFFASRIIRTSFQEEDRKNEVNDF